MSTPTVTLHRVDGGDARSYVESVLAANDLPVSDVAAKPAWFYVAVHEDKRIGVGGVERHGAAGLLRSVVVEEPRRGAGFGTALCDALEARARDADLTALYLLTTTTAAFFADRGFTELARDEVPDAIRQTTQFQELCPASATAMRKPL